MFKMYKDHKKSHGCLLISNLKSQFVKRMDDRKGIIHDGMTP